jgi:hypothetical protein
VPFSARAISEIVSGSFEPLFKVNPSVRDVHESPTHCQPLGPGDPQLRTEKARQHLRDQCQP